MSPERLPDIFFSTFQYAACKAAGEEWPKVLAELLEHPERGPEMLGFPGLSFATMHEARHIATIVQHVQSGTYIARGRCVAAAEFLRGGGRDCDVWLTCDDDQYAEEESLRQLVTACRATRGLVAMPSINRNGRTMCYRRVYGPTEWWASEARPGVSRDFVIIGDQPGPGRIPLRRVDRVGQGLVAMHRDLIARLDEECEVRFRDRQALGAHDCPGLFLSAPLDGEWVGEDYWFCALAEQAGFSCHVLLDAFIQHAELVTKLDLDGVVHIVGQDKADRMAEAILRMNAEARAAGINV